MANKYGNVKVRGYDSKKEARRGDELRLLERAGKIRDLREQVKYELIPSMYAAADGTVMASTQEDPISQWSRKKRGMWCVERACSYVADFVYVDAETGKTVVEDVKSPATRTPEYRIKRKLMLWIYGIQIKEV
jgi:hypothetical protein